MVPNTYLGTANDVDLLKTRLDHKSGTRKMVKELVQHTHTASVTLQWL